MWTGLRPGSQQATQVAEGRGKKRRGTAVARTAPEAKPDAKPAGAEAKPAAKPATANASAGGFSLTPSIKLPSASTFTPASAETKPVAAPASGDKNGAAKPKAAAKPDQKAAGTKPAAKPKTAEKPDAKSTKQ